MSIAQRFDRDFIRTATEVCLLAGIPLEDAATYVAELLMELYRLAGEDVVAEADAFTLWAAREVTGLPLEAIAAQRQAMVVKR